MGVDHRRVTGQTLERLGQLTGEGDDGVDVEVGADRLAGPADAVGLVGLEAVQGEAVLVRVDGDGADAQLVAGAEDADCDLAAVGGEELADGWGLRLSRHGGPLLNSLRKRELAPEVVTK